MSRPTLDVLQAQLRVAAWERGMEVAFFDLEGAEFSLHGEESPFNGYVVKWDDRLGDVFSKDPWIRGRLLDEVCERLRGLVGPGTVVEYVVVADLE